MTRLITNVEVIGRNSNLAYLSKKWSELRKRISESAPRRPLLHQDERKVRTKRFLSITDAAAITARYQAGETTQEIAASYGISKTRVATTIREQGIAIRRQGLDAEQLSEAAVMYVEGKSLAWLGARYGVSHTTVAAALREHGVPLRPRRGWQ